MICASNPQPSSPLFDAHRYSTCAIFKSAFRNLHSAISWCRGQDSNLRRALARRVYSPVPLTARPPLQISALNPSQTSSAKPELVAPCTKIRPSRKFATLADFDPVCKLQRGLTDRDKSLCRRMLFYNPFHREAHDSLTHFRHVDEVSMWSRRRDSNPRPSDYKSDALPTELRRPNHAPQTIHKGLLNTQVEELSGSASNKRSTEFSPGRSHGGAIC